ncbi:Chemotaxis protein [Caenorhabditis elegans]|uniref:Chemotaxis protein n=1 Tax=Caenorhabditis elegans TaxID=6239 RepID=O45253_CAEEL|nr:Chemotaxis protein [Caenorhabditis elegans]CAB07166.1 Chemotaxis protein [Caenorhabditis elegans]|eukprot:NP_493294.1 Uncharacterized protein CELE_C17H1.2 [Caenorhabditis elegans]
MSENESENTNVFSEFLYDIGDFFSGNDRKQEKQLQADLRAAQAADLEFHKNELEVSERQADANRSRLSALSSM